MHSEAGVCPNRYQRWYQPHSIGAGRSEAAEAAPVRGSARRVPGADRHASLQVRPALPHPACEGDHREAAGKGVELRLSPDRTTIVPSGNRAYFDAACAAAPLLWPLLAEGTPPACAVSAHADPVEAVTVADAFPDGLPW